MLLYYVQASIIISPEVNNLIEVRNLTKKYGENVAVSNLSFTIAPGKIYGFLGPNGAGKSTTMNIIAGTLAATEGTVLINGHDIYEDPIAAKRCIGYLPEMPPLYNDMTPYEYLSFVAEAKGVEYDKIIKRVKEVMELTQLLDVRNKLIRNLSKGYKQRVGIAQAMLGNPDIIILDEPTVGLDPYQIIEIRELIKELGKTKTVILSSHILAEVAEVCNHIMIISGGKLVANDTLENLEAGVNRSDTLHMSVRATEAQARQILSRIGKIIDLDAETDDEICHLTVYVEKGADMREDIFYAFADARLAIISMSLEKVTLESVFLELTSPDAETQDKISESSDDTDESNDDSDEETPEDDVSAPEKKSSKDKKDDDDDYTPLFS